jgi:ABC-2 type transport system ATP-binding protein
MAAAEPRLSGAGIEKAVETALDRVGLLGAAHRRYRAYSLGMKQRLGLASALLVPRRMVVLDEPTNGLDPSGTREIRKIIGELHADGVTVLVSSHLLAEVEATCTHVAVLHDGTVVAQGELAELLESGSPALLVSTLDAERAVEVLREHRIASRLIPDGVRVDLTTSTPPAVVELLVRGGVGIYEATKARTGLEDLFARLTQDEPSTSDETPEVTA